MPVLNSNSTNYVHSSEPNTSDLTMAMEYNSQGEPVLRVNAAISDVSILNECLKVRNCDNTVLLVSANGNVNTPLNPIAVSISSGSSAVTQSLESNPWIVDFEPNKIDAMGRLRVSEPFNIFDSQQRYFDHNQWSTAITNGDGEGSGGDSDPRFPP